MARLDFDPSTSIPDLTGKKFLITGGNQGIGQQTVLALAKHAPSHIYFTARSTTKAQDTLTQLKNAAPNTPVTVIECDLSSLASVKSAAQDFLSKSDSLDVLILNAGIMSVPPAQTTEGYEIQMGSNHIGHALLTKLLLPTLEENAKMKDTRIVVVSSQGAQMARGIGYDALKTDGKSRVIMGSTGILYAESKLANVYFARQLAAHYPSITSVSIHPGIVGTNLVTSQSSFQRAVIKISTYVVQSGATFTPEQGAYNSLWGATVAKDKIQNGEYYEPVGMVGRQTKVAKNEAGAKKLWDWTEEELKGWTL